MTTLRYKQGIRCGLCESKDTSVIQTIHVDHGVRRIRKCNTCQHRFTTYEINAARISTDPKFDFLFRKATSQ